MDAAAGVVVTTVGHASHVAGHNVRTLSVVAHSVARNSQSAWSSFAPHLFVSSVLVLVLVLVLVRVLVVVDVLVLVAGRADVVAAGHAPHVAGHASATDAM